jgi:tetratricopeptide (TPR) repeat protein
LEKRGLIVLDNVWNERALFQTMKAIPPTLPVLVTSRHVIPIDGESVYVTGLNSSGAIELLNYHARQDYSDDLMAFTLCETLGYHPFAIEIAGKHLRIHPTLHPEQLLGNIGETPHDLSIPSEYGEVGREGIKDLLDLSVRALSTEAHALFVMMGALFAPYASLKLLAALLGEPIDVIHEGLRTLQRHGLAVIFDARDNAPLHYQIHDLTYSYARTLHGRKTGYDALMITTIREFVETYVNDYDLLDFEQVNILGAAKYADEIDNKAALIDIMTMLMVDGYFDNRGHTNTLLFLADRAISAAEAMGEDYYRALHYLFSKRGNAFVERGDLDSAFLAYSRAVELAPTPNRKATILTVISGVRFRQGASDYDDYLEQGYQIAVENNDDDVICRVLWHRGINAAQSHDLDAAHEYLTQSVEVAARMEDRSKPYLPLYNLGIVEIDRGEFENAIVTLERAYGIAMQADNQAWIAHALSGLGRAHHGLGKREKAQAYLQQSLQLYRKLGQATAEAWVADLMKQESYTINSDSTEGV